MNKMTQHKIQLKVSDTYISGVINTRIKKSINPSSHRLCHVSSPIRPDLLQCCVLRCPDRVRFPPPRPSQPHRRWSAAMSPRPCQPSPCRSREPGQPSPSSASQEIDSRQAEQIKEAFTSCIRIQNLD
uniref:Uncharacterized protein n=1 Tax=Arundo donax TaxID=35708 RepID=A0A0A9I220_ARUDO